jgi:peptide/nickel transport system ATP-binding protein
LSAPPLLSVDGVSRRFVSGSAFSGGRRVLYAVDNVSLQLSRGETLALVGESGCGKSTLGRCMLRLDEVSEGRVVFQGLDLARLSAAALRRLRPRMQMVFQDPYGSLNPRRRVGDLIAEPLRVHRDEVGRRRSAPAIAARLQELVQLVGLRAEHLARYPHEFSGGQRQRIGIARALALQPDLVVADEPVSALDVSVQAQVVNLLADLQERLGLTYVFIAHDLAVVRQIATRTAVMYLGSIVEIGETQALFAAPAHPYTAALLAAVPGRGAARAAITGDVPSPWDPPAGCRFHPRCPRAQARCKAEAPVLVQARARQLAACHYPLR